MNTVFINGNLSIDRKACCVYINGQQVHLTPVEYKLLDLLARHIGQVLSYDFIISEVWGQNKQDTSSLRVFMSTLRKKVEKDPSHPVYLLTHPRIGYRMAQATMPEDDLS